MEATPTTEPKKRGRPKGSTKSKGDKEKDSGGRGGAAQPKMRGSGGEKKNAAAEESYAHWKLLVLVLYDWLAHHNLVWPSFSCRWGPVLEQGNYKTKQRLYLSEQFDEDARSPYVKKYKTILHPGEVNRIRELPQNKNIVATHTDCPEVLIWDIESQPNRHAVLGASESRPDLVLSRH